jgi:hypothetical protein
MRRPWPNGGCCTMEEICTWGGIFMGLAGEVWLTEGKQLFIFLITSRQHLLLIQTYTHCVSELHSPTLKWKAFKLTNVFVVSSVFIISTLHSPYMSLFLRIWPYITCLQFLMEYLLMFYKYYKMYFRLNETQSKHAGNRNFTLRKLTLKNA